MQKAMPQRVRLEEEDWKSLKIISDGAGISQTDVVSMLLTAAVRSVRAAGHQFHFPLRFRLESESFQKTERPAAPAAPAPAKARKP